MKYFAIESIFTEIATKAMIDAWASWLLKSTHLLHLSSYSCSALL